MSDEITLFAGGANSFSEAKVKDFINFVAEGGEVERSTLESNVPNAVYLIFLYKNSNLIGTAALKMLDTHRATVFRKAEIGNPEKYPYELGYIRVDDTEQGKGFSKVLVSIALSQAKGEGIYATSATEKIYMHKTLEKFQFVKNGKKYDSNKKDRKLQVFLKGKVVRE